MFFPFDIVWNWFGLIFLSCNNVSIVKFSSENVKNSVDKETTKTRTIVVKDKESQSTEEPSTHTTSSESSKPSNTEKTETPSKPVTENTTSGGTSTEKDKGNDKDKTN